MPVNMRTVMMDLIIAALIVLLIVLVIKLVKPCNVMTENMYPVRNDIPSRFRKLGGSSIEIDPLEFEHLSSRIYRAKHDWRNEYDADGNAIPDKLHKSLGKYMSNVENCCGSNKKEHCCSQTGDKKENLSNLDNHCGGSLCALACCPNCPMLNRIGLENFSSQNDKIIGIEKFENGDVDRTWSSTIYTRNDEPHFNPTTPKPIFANMKYLQNRGKYKCYDKCEKLSEPQSRSECMEDCRRLSATVY